LGHNGLLGQHFNSIEWYSDEIEGTTLIEQSREGNGILKEGLIINLSTVEYIFGCEDEIL
jgi:hypothetical protein